MSSDDRATMQRVAARIMGLSLPASSGRPSTSSNATASTPRTIPSTSASVAPLSNENMLLRPSAATPGLGVASPPPAAMLFPVPTVNQRDPNRMPEAADGPSLRGDAAALAEARAMQAGLTRAGSKTRPAPRARAEPTFSRTSSSSTSSRTTPIRSLANELGASRPTSAAPLHGPTTRFETSPRAEPVRQSSNFGMASLHDRPSITPAVAQQPAAAGASMWSMGGLTNHVATPTIMETMTAESDPSPKMIEKLFGNSAMKEATGVLKDLAPDNNAGSSTPPHLRAKAAAGSAKTTTAVSTSEKAPMFAPAVTNDVAAILAPKPATQKQVVKSESKGETLLGATTPANIVSTPAVSRPASPTAPPSPKPGNKGKEKIANGEIPGSFPEPTPTKASSSLHANNTVPSTMSTDDQVLTNLEKIQLQMAALITRMRQIEAENFENVKSIEELQQNDEKRKYLGTDHAKVPFMIFVNYPAGHALQVQVNAEITVAELIRRARAKGDVAPGASPNPRMMYEDEPLGHCMLLGEVGIGRGFQVDFRYD